MEINKNTLLDESVSKTIYIVAAPTMLHMLLETSYHLIDAFWLGMLGANALAAVASASFLLWMVFSICIIVETGVNSLIARYYGSDSKELLQRTAYHGMKYGALIAFCVAFIMLLFQRRIFEMMGLEEIVIANAISFFTPILCGLPLFNVVIAGFAVFRGTGDTKTPLKVLFISLIINTVLAPLLIFGPGVFPELGISGAAIATVISQIIALFINIYILKEKKILIKTDNKILDPEIVRKITKIGFPVAINGVVFCIVYLFLTKIISEFGTAPVAAIGIGHRIESLAYCISVGFSIAATTLVGQSLGANMPERAKEIAWKMNFYAGGFILIFCLFILIFNNLIAGIFTSDSQVLTYTSAYLKVIAFIEVFMAFEIVMEGVFSGYGNTLPMTIVGLPANIMRIPLAYYLSQKMGVNGVWLAIGFTTAFKGIMLILWFRIYTSSPQKLEALS